MNYDDDFWIATTQLIIQLMFSALFQLNSTNDKLMDIQQTVVEEVQQVCTLCNLQVGQIQDGEFSCPSGADSRDVLYRARLRSTPPNNCIAVVTTVASWVQSSETSLQVQGSRLSVAQNCILEIDSFDSELECPVPTTQGGGGVSEANSSSSTVIGGAAGAVGVIILLTVLVVIIAIVIIVKKKTRKRLV